MLMVKCNYDRRYCLIVYNAIIFNTWSEVYQIGNLSLYNVRDLKAISTGQKITYFLYRLQAAIIFRFSHRTRGLPAIDLSHIISLISPIASVVFASSKNSTVYICSPCFFMFFRASVSAVATFRTISSFVVPPCTCNKTQVVGQRFIMIAIRFVFIFKCEETI